MIRDTEKCPLSVLTGVRTKRVNFRENIRAFCRGKRNCPYKTGVRRAGFHCMQLCWKYFLKLYLASTTDGLKKREACRLLKSCVAGFLRKLSTRYKHQELSMVCPVLEVYEERAQLSLISGPQKRNVIVPVKCATKNTQFGNVMCSREWNIYRKKWETAKKLGLCYRCLGKGHLGDPCTWNRECGIDGCKDRHHGGEG